MNQSHESGGEPDSCVESSRDAGDSSPDTPQIDDALPTIRFQLVHAFYAMTVIGTCLAIFGWPGVLPVFLVLAFWMTIFVSRSRVRTFAIAVIPAICVIWGCAALVPEVTGAREDARRMQ